VRRANGVMEGKKARLSNFQKGLYQKEVPDNPGKMGGKGGATTGILWKDLGSEKRCTRDQTPEKPGNSSG